LLFSKRPFGPDPLGVFETLHLHQELSQVRQPIVRVLDGSLRIHQQGRWKCENSETLRFVRFQIGVNLLDCQFVSELPLKLLQEAPLCRAWSAVVAAEV